MTIGPRVRERRIALGLSQENLAHAAGLSWGAIQRLEAGKIVDPHYSTLEGIAHTLGTTIAELVGEKEPVPLDKAPEVAVLAAVHKLMSDARQREDWREAVDDWRRFRSGAKESLREQLSRWEAARDQGISYEGRREFLDIVGWILDGASSVSRKLLQNLPYGSGPLP